MIQKQKKLALFYLIVGLVISLVFGTGGDDYNTGLLCGLGTSFAAVGIIRLLKYYRLSKNPDKLADYEAIYTDERVLYIANKARALVFMISIYAQLAAGLIAQFVFSQRLVSIVLCYSVCFQCFLFVGIYHYYSKKY